MYLLCRVFENPLCKEQMSWMLLWVCFSLFKLSLERLGITELEKRQKAGPGPLPKEKINSCKVNAVFKPTL